MVKAFVFGKFLPFHNGHKAMVDFAIKQCDSLTVVVCSSSKETLDGPRRAKWIKEIFERQPNIEVVVFDYDEEVLPNTSVPSEEVSAIWAKQFKLLLPEAALLITSEHYGAMVARHMGIEHISYDEARTLTPISATKVRNDVFGNWHYLPDSVKQYFAVKVVILGTESTGKTTLTEKLAAHFDCGYVAEVGREVVPDSNKATIDDLHTIANGHAASINRQVLQAGPLVIIDTDIHMTQSYARFLFNETLKVSNGLYEANRAQLYLYLCNDAPYVQDGTRLNEEDRNLLDMEHRKTLKEYSIEIKEIRGGWQQRFERAVAHIEYLLEDVKSRQYRC